MSRGRFRLCSTCLVNPTLLSSKVATRTGNRCISLWSYAPVVSFLIVLLQRDITPRKMLLRFVGRLSLSSTLAILWGLCLA
ncbi:hypothetical protein LINGRAHAP2_LOCUS22288 [Linum grandiflorum]